MDALQSPRRGHYTDRIEGSFRSITVHQLALAWWLHAAGHLTRRQLRVWFALHELAERRRYAEKGRQPRYTLDEVLALVGGRRQEGSGGAKARSELSADLRALERLGLATMREAVITFARSADQIAPELVDDLGGFWSMLESVPNRRRAVPVPRRMVRALAAGFPKATMALIIAMLIRGLFWHREHGDYRIDGRVKLSWVADVFAVSRRRLTEARATLIDLGWLEPLDPSQWELNRWGQHDRINPAWSLNRSDETSSPNADFSGQTSTPDLTDSLCLSAERNTRTPADTAGTDGVSLDRSTDSGNRGEEPSRQGRRSVRTPSKPPNIRDIRPADLANTGRLLELHRQACAIGLATNSEHGRLEFLSFAERARSRGKSGGALFYWLLRERKTAFITLSDEDEAARRLREHLNGPRRREPGGEQWGGQETRQPAAPTWTEDDRIVMACVRVAQQRGLDDPFWAAQCAKGWPRERWDAAHHAYHQKQLARTGSVAL